MCLAIPMRVTKTSGDPDDFTTSQIATVDADGISKEIRLDVVDRWPEVGESRISCPAVTNPSHPKEDPAAECDSRCAGDHDHERIRSPKTGGSLQAGRLCGL